MLLSEAKARNLWCPMVRVEGDNRMLNTLTDGFENTTKAYHCIGSHCMAWREFHLSYMHGSTEASEKHGYCGLAGRPELE
jgi:hypothetical protein